MWTREPLLLDKDDEKLFESCGQEFSINSKMEPIHMFEMDRLLRQNTGQCKSIILVSAVWDRRGSKL